jgi:hypothetical protein
MSHCVSELKSVSPATSSTGFAALAADIVPAPPEVHSSSLWRLVAVAGKACMAHLFGKGRSADAKSEENLEPNFMMRKFMNSYMLVLLTYSQLGGI